jgi:hypothetical protein
MERIKDLNIYIFKKIIHDPQNGLMKLKALVLYPSKQGHPTYHLVIHY